MQLMKIPQYELVSC